MVFEKIKAWFRNDPRYNWIDSLSISYLTGAEKPEDEGWYIVNLDGTEYAGPYKTNGAAKGQLTRLRKGYTPAARR
jgi:hypothetical protein